MRLPGQIDFQVAVIGVDGFVAVFLLKSGVGPHKTVSMVIVEIKGRFFPFVVNYAGNSFPVGVAMSFSVGRNHEIPAVECAEKIIVVVVFALIVNSSGN